MSEKKTIADRGPKADSVFSPNESFDNAFVALDNPDDAEIQQYGNGTTMVVNDNPDDYRDKIERLG